VAVRPKPIRPSAPAPRRRSTPARPRRAGRRGEAGDATVARPRSSAPLPKSPLIVRPSPGAGGLSRGDYLFLVFFVAAIIMVVAVVLVGAVGQMWVLVPVMLVDFMVTFAVIAVLVILLGDDGGSSGRYDAGGR
jgi:hypothetical protein